MTAIKLVISRGVQVYSPPKELRKRIYADLTFENKKYTDAKKYGHYISSDEMPQLYFFSVNKEKKYVYVPRGYISKLISHMKELGLERNIVDKTMTLEKIDFTFKGTPRPYQKQAIKDLRKYPCGVLQASTGSGKTFMAINMIAIRKQPTLIIVHTKELLNQWVDSLEKLLEIPVGVVGDGKYEIEDVTVGIIQSVRNNITRLQLKFGHIIIDECHRCPANVWIETLQQFPARYYLGLSATVFRNDGLGEAINCFIGPTKHEVDREELHETGAVLKPKIIMLNTRFNAPPRTDYQKMISALCSNKERNTYIVNAVLNDLRYFNAPVLIVSDRVMHCEILRNMLEERGQTVSFLVSKVGKKEREYAVDDIRDGTSKILIATLSLIGEGFDAPNLHALFLTTPIKFSGRIIQTIGRVLRPEDRKVPRVYDFRDDSIWTLRKAGKQREKIYKEQWG